MGSFAISIIITIVLGIWGSKTLRKMMPSVEDVDKDTRSENFESEEDCLMNESDHLRTSAAKPSDRFESALESDDEAAVGDDIQFDLRQAVIYETILHNEHTGIR